MTTPDDLAERFAELRETRGTIPALDQSPQRGETCSRCHVGHQTKLILRTRRHGQQRDEKVVCSHCWQVNADRLGEEESARVTPRWSGNPTRAPHASHVETTWWKPASPHAPPIRPGAAEARMIATQDAWDRVAPLFERVPPGSNPKRWRLGVEAIVLLQHQDLGSHALVAEVGPHYHPELGPWTEGDVERAVRFVRLTIERRKRDRHWRLREMELDPNDAITTGEAGEILGYSAETVRKLIARRKLPGSDWRTPGALRAEWRTSRKACLELIRQRGSASANGEPQDAACGA